MLELDSILIVKDDSDSCSSLMSDSEAIKIKHTYTETHKHLIDASNYSHFKNLGLELIMLSSKFTSRAFTKKFYSIKLMYDCINK